LKASPPQEERQAAYVIHERFAQVDHFHQFIEDTLSESLRWTLGRARELVQEFTSVKDIEKARLERKQLEQIALQAASTALLIASALVGIAPVTGLPSLLAGQTGIALTSVEGAVAGSAAGMNMLASSYIGITGLVTKARNNP
jgi:hypothetical protein